MTNAPRPYELSHPQELVRLMNECCGYLRTCRAEHHGTDSAGRGHAIDALPKAAETLESLLAEMRSEREWRPIETAPKDGTVILLFARHVDATASAPVIGHYQGRWEAVHYWGQGDAPLVPSCWMPRPAFPNLHALNGEPAVVPSSVPGQAEPESDPGLPAGSSAQTDG